MRRARRHVRFLRLFSGEGTAFEAGGHPCRHEIAGEPLNKELYSTDNLWFYYTDPKWYDGMVTQDECTPFLFDDDGILQGWGHQYFHDHGILSVWTQKAINSAVWF